MKLRFIPVFLQMVAVFAGVPASASELIYEGFRQDTHFKVYLD